MDRDDLQLRVYRVLPPWLQGRAIRYGTPNFTVGSMVYLTDDGKRVLLSRPSYRNGWLPTGGFIGKGETPQETITREVVEELGVPAEVQPYHRVAFNVGRRGITFISVGRIAKDAQLSLSSEVLEAKWFDLDDLPEMPADFHEQMLPEDVEALRQLFRKP